MKLKSSLFAISAALVALSAKPAAAAEEATQRPNILVIVADDLGFSDIGAFGSEISTPNLDALALKGVRFTGFHTAPTCSPTRAMLLSGTDNHRAGLGSMAELTAPNQRGKPGYEGYLRPDIASIAEIFSSNGYRTVFSGKWHLGITPEQDPHARGFQQSFALLQGGHNHYGTGLTVERGKGENYTKDGQILSSLPADFYSSDAFAAGLINELDTSAGSGKPFFAYLAFTAPHWPLQAPPETIAKYRGRYDAGYEVLRTQRLKKQVELGLLPAKTTAHSLNDKTPRWDSLTPQQKQEAARDMEIYAAMVDRMDSNVGRVINHLRETGQLDNTIIFFLADNGAEGLNLSTTELPMMKARLAKADNRLENRGKASSYVAYGPGWAQAATAPSWLYKAYATEGGTRTVAFLTGPGLPGAGGVRNSYLNVMDVVPTFIDLAGITTPKGELNGRAVQPILGKSWARWLRGQEKQVYSARQSIGTELFGSRALRQGDWKITDTGDNIWRLFNIAQDPGETTDLSASQPARREELIKAWNDYASRVGVILPSERLYRP